MTHNQQDMQELVVAMVMVGLPANSAHQQRRCRIIKERTEGLKDHLAQIQRPTSLHLLPIHTPHPLPRCSRGHQPCPYSVIPCFLPKPSRSLGSQPSFPPLSSPPPPTPVAIKSRCHTLAPFTSAPSLRHRLLQPAIAPPRPLPSRRAASSSAPPRPDVANT